MGDNLLREHSSDLPYQSNLGWHSEEGVLEALQRLEGLNVNSQDYWELKSRLIECISGNAIEQFSRGKYDAGMLTKDHLDEITLRLSRKEEEKSDSPQEDYF